MSDNAMTTSIIGITCLCFLLFCFFIYRERLDEKEYALKMAEQGYVQEFDQNCLCKVWVKDGGN